MKLRLKRPLALLLSMVLLLGTLPSTAFAAESDGLCPHHPRHDDTCGYVEAAAGQSCLHQHDGTCGYTEGTPEVPCDKDCTDTDGDGVVDHAVDCAYQPAVSGAPCNHIHNADCGYVEAVEGHPCKYAKSPCPECAAEAEADNQPPANNGGQEPDTGNPTPQANGEVEITSLELLNFTEHGESTSNDVDLLERTDDGNAVKWDVFNPYTLEIGVSLPAGIENNTLTLTLPNGMKFVNLNTDNLEQTQGIASANYKKPEKIYNYQPENGQLTVVFGSGVTNTTVTVSIQPDVAFFPVEKREEGLLIENAIQVELESGDETDGQKIPVDVQINEDANDGAPSYETLRIGDISDATPDVAPGETYNLSGNVWTGWFTYNEKQNYRLRSELVVVLSVPNVLTLENLSDFWTVAKGAADSENTDNTLWTLTAKGLYNRTPSFTGQIGVKIPNNAEPRTTYAIKQHSISVTTYGQDTPWEVGGTENDKPLWTLTVKDPTKVEIGITAGNAINVYDYTQKLSSNGQPFTDYNTSLAGCVITNTGVADIKQGLIYKATFDQNVQFVTAVGIPCGWDETEDEWLPTKITITTDKDTTHTISVKDGDYSAIRNVASLAYPDYGFILRAVDIPEFNPEESIVSVEVELPGLPKGYKSSGYPVCEQAGANNAYSGVWGRVREDRDETKTGTNTFSIYLKDDDTSFKTQTSTTTIVDPGKLSATSPASEITVDNAISTSVSSGDAIHISQKIVPHNAYGSFHNTEVLWYDPVIYLLEPEDMTIENVKFTLTTTNSDGSTTSEEINYNWTPVSNASGLQDGYQLYEYTLNEKVLLGWWSGDWENTSLTVDFDYSVDPTAKTLSYDVQDLIFYKSSLGFEVGNNPVTDKYNLNSGKAIGGVATNTFTVQAVSGFNIAASIQIKGEDQWYTYDPENTTDTTAVFKDGDTANVRVTVINNSGDNTSNVEVYIPIPKKNGVDLGDAFLSDPIGFDMLVGDEADTTKAEGWSVQYGQVDGVSYTGSGVPDKIKLKDGTDWSDSYENANMIKISLSKDGTLENGGQAQIILKFKATTETSLTDSRNIFKSWWKYSAGDTAMVDTPQDGKWIYNFGTLLQNGVVSGTVYLDANGNGVMDSGEKGIAGVPVKAVDADGREYTEQKTDENGKYSFKSLPGNKSVTITVINPGSTDPSQTNAYRFSKTVASTTEQIGSDVTANETGSQATVTLENLGTSGTATVNAGLMTPCTVTFSDGEKGSVSPGTVKIFPGQTLGDVLNQAPSVTPTSGHKHTGWYRGTETTLITNEQLLEQTITGDTTFTAQYSTLYTVTVEGSYAGNNSGAGQYTAGDTVTIDAGSHAGLTFKGWTVTSDNAPLVDATNTTTTFTMPAGNVTVTANWASNEKIQVTPADIIIYMGGKPYEGAVDGSGTIITNQNAGLPEPGFRVTLPDALKDKGITSLTFKEKDGDRTWTFQPYDGQPDTAVYKLVPAKGQEATRVQFTKADGTVIPSDEFEVGREVNTSFQMGLYKGSGETKVGDIIVEVDGVEYAVDSSTGELTVLGTTEKVSITTVTDQAPTNGQAGAVETAGTTYTINDSEVKVTDGDVSLLFDSIINHTGNDRTGKLETRASEWLTSQGTVPTAQHQFVYELKYLDLVDANNGNAWVTASQDLTIYWPYPAGTNKDTEFTLLHFEGLHREMDTSEIGDQIANCTVSEVTVVGKTDTHIVLKVGSAGFSPFALVWEEKIPTYTITATAGTGGSITPAGVTTVQEGGSQSYTIKADSGYHISDVKVNGVSGGAVESYTFTNVRSNQTIAVTFSRNSSGGGGGGGGHTKPSDPDEDIPDESGPADPFDTGVGNWLNTKDHNAYLGGYGGGLFGPDDNMTRGQAAQMFYNLLLDKDVPITVSFTDVAPDAWYATAVNTLASLGIVTGYGNGQFGPDDSITRAQFTTIAMRFANLDTSGENIFTDVSEDDWFYEFVVGAIKYGWIGGYPDGRFGPNDTITRAQVTTIVNRMLGRSADEDYVERNIEELTRFTDVPDTHWAYYNIMEATNAHDYDHVKGQENWTRLHR